MSVSPALVHLIVDEQYGFCVDQLPVGEPAWIIDSPSNRIAVEKRWAEFPSQSHLTGITLFSSVAASAEDAVINELDTIDLHHGFYSADVPYVSLRIVGAAVTPRLTVALSEYGMTRVEATGHGFIARRPETSQQR